MLDRFHGLTMKSSAGTQYLQSMKLFQVEDIKASCEQLTVMFEKNKAEDFNSMVVERALIAAKHIEERTEELLATRAKGAKESSYRNLETASLSLKLRRLKKLISHLSGHTSKK